MGAIDGSYDKGCWSSKVNSEHYMRSDIMKMKNDLNASSTGVK